ncbi:MAG: hydrogen gas-evolving membrane-bound hydrogenase subunit E [Acidimicrobiales bacterium]
MLVGAGHRLGRRAFAVAGASTAVGLALAVAHAGEVLDGAAVVERRTWVPSIGLTLDLRLDAMGLLMVLLVTGIGVLVHAYAARSFAADREGVHRLAGLLALFTAAMVLVVTADDLLLLYVGWELTSVTSYLLVGWNDRDPRARASALQAILITGAGGLAMLGGFVLIGESAGTYQLSALLASPPAGTAVEVGLVLVLLGAFTKSAQWPFSSWLPGAMVAPSPVSAYLHSATMVKAGVYLVARFAPAFADQGAWRPIVLAVGLTTMVLGGWRALRQYDLKRILAFGTVSQLGFLIVLFGAGTPEATAAGVAVLLAHALFKATLFLVVGVIDHQTRTRDIRALGAYGPGWNGPRTSAALAGASMAGVPLLFGFVAKESAYEAFVHPEIAGGTVVLAGLVVGSILTFAYTGRLLLGAFRPGAAFEGIDAIEPLDPTDVPTVVDPPAPALAFWAPAGLLAAITLLLGLVPDLASHLVGAAASALDGEVEAKHLAVWHGVNQALVLSLITMASGAALVVLGRRVGWVQQRLRAPFDGGDAYLVGLRGLNRVADRVTGVLQNGSLPVYTGVILVTVTALPALALIGAPLPDDLSLTSSPGDWAVAALLVVAGAAACVLRHRMAAVLALGAVGYAMALLFVLQGAPDLALTQLAIETLGAVLFVLVLRRLPTHFDDRPTSLSRGVRLAVAGLVSLVVFAFALIAGGVRVAPPVSSTYLAQALPEGGGRNVVNVILVDFRGFDTMGEVTVLVVAALGVVSIARLHRRDDEAIAPQLLAAPGPARPFVRRSLLVDTVVRVVFHTVLVLAAYLLFAGHNQPGGGFVAGLVAGAAFALRYGAGGMDEVRASLRVKPWILLGVGLALVSATALASLVAGDAVLESAKATLSLGLLGHAKVTSALAFDTGVLLVVLGMVLMLFEAFGDPVEGEA